jgi:hypothetical protein
VSRLAFCPLRNPCTSSAPLPENQTPASQAPTPAPRTPHTALLSLGSPPVPTELGRSPPSKTREVTLANLRQPPYRIREVTPSSTIQPARGRPRSRTALPFRDHGRKDCLHRIASRLAVIDVDIDSDTENFFTITNAYIQKTVITESRKNRNLFFRITAPKVFVLQNPSMTPCATRLRNNFAEAPKSRRDLTTWWGMV